VVGTPDAIVRKLSDDLRVMSTLGSARISSPLRAAR